MTELLHFAFAPVNVPFTLLLIVVLLYWASVMIGVVGIGVFDTDIDTDLHHEVHVDKGVNMDVEPHAGWFGVVLGYFNVGSVPFMILMSFVSLFLWIGAILGNYYLGGGAWWMGVLLFVPNLLVALFLTRLITSPLKRIFREGQNPVESNHNLIGRTCTVLLPATDGKIGQAEVAIQRGAPLLLTVKTTSGHKLARGEKGLVIDYDKNAHTYLIEPYDLTGSNLFIEKEKQDENQSLQI
jgi:membrane protein implicated in regulation of membrane protease activity